MVSTLSVNRSYGNVIEFLKRYFFIKLSVSAAEKIVDGSSKEYEEYYYSSRIETEKIEIVMSEGELTVVSFDGKGVPVIKKEAAKIVAKLGKGEKKQKKKEALVGVKYNIDPNIRICFI